MMAMPFVVAGLVFCAGGLIILTYLVIQTQIELKAMQKSTHQVQYVRSDEFEKLNEKLTEELTKDVFDNLN